MAVDIDVVVIGAGIAGAAAAWALAEHVGVTLVERESAAGMHATGRSAAMLSETSGHPVVGALAKASRGFLEQPPDGFCATPLTTPRGLAWIGREGDTELLDDLVTTAATVDADIRRLSPAEAQELLPGFRAEAVAGGAVYEPGAVALDAAALLQGFVGGARRRGADVLTTSEAVRGRRRPDGTWVVVAGERELSCRHVVDAAGAWGDVVAARCGVAPLGLRPLRRTAAIVPAPDWTSKWPLVMDVAGRFYVEPETGGLLLSPADENESEPCDARPEELDVALGLDALAEATEIPVRSVRHAWAGLRTFAPDRVPVLGEDPAAPGFWWLVGQGGAGIKTSPAMAMLLAAEITGAEPFDTALADRLHPRRLR